jgi:hypothetical protein
MIRDFNFKRENNIERVCHCQQRMDWCGCSPSYYTMKDDFSKIEVK